MRRLSRLITPAIIPLLLLVGCAKTATEQLEVSGARTAIVLMNLLGGPTKYSSKPTAPLGVFATLYTSQGIFLPASTAMSGVEAQKRLLEAQINSDTDETFALLKEVGEILSVDIRDLLNRSSNRVQAMDSYLQSLRNANILIERKLADLDALYDRQNDEQRALSREMRDVERDINTAMREQDYGEAARLEEELTDISPRVAEMRTKAERTDDIRDRFQVLEDVAQERLQAVENNREILISGLRVIEVPGIIDLGILQEGSSYRTRRSSSVFD